MFPFFIFPFPVLGTCYPSFSQVFLRRTPLGRVLTRVLSRIYGLEKSRVAEGDEFPRGVQDYALPEIFGNEYALRCNLVHFETQF